MRILFVTESSHTGKTPRNHPNMRTEFAWQYLLDADHIPISQIGDVSGYDIILVILPKKGNVRSLELIQYLKRFAKVGIIQEGPNDYWHNYDLEGQISHAEALKATDFILAHNSSDVSYYKFYNPKVDVIRSAMPDWLEFPRVERKNVMIGGNFCQWYNGYDSYEVARKIKREDEEIFAPSMGRKIAGEELLVTNLPYMNHQDFLSSLNHMRVGVHLMRTFAAGTFALNCAFLGIPCIGYDYLDSQRICFPRLSTTCPLLNIAFYSADILDKCKYLDFSSVIRSNFNQYFHSSVFQREMPQKLARLIA